MINSFDIETFVDEKNHHHIPYCICFSLKNNYYFIYYKENEDIIIASFDLIFTHLKIEEYSIFYIHKLNFDGILLLSALSKQQIYTFSFFTKESEIFAIRVFFNKKTIDFRCSKKILPLSLKQIASAFNLKKKLPFPYKFASKNNLYYRGDLPAINFFNSIEDRNNFIQLKIFDFKKYSITYCLRDVYITKFFMQKIWKYVKQFNINFKDVYSAPSLSLKIFENCFNKDKIKLKHNTFLDSLIRPAYYGGRCEVYGNAYEDEKIFHFDFSGMYAQCMQQNFAHGSYKIITNEFDLTKPGYYAIQFSSKNMYLPVLPHHRLKNNKLMFTNGLLSGTYWFEEILKFLELGGEIIKINYGIVFEKYTPVFFDFINFFDILKKKGQVEKEFGKLIINSLYGRLGMDEYVYHSFFIKTEEFDTYNKKFNILSRQPLNEFELIKIELNEKAINFLNLKPSKNKSNISIAAAITAKARIKLLNAQLEVAKQGGRLLYSDTDSIYAAFKKNVLNEKHGEIFWDSNKADTVVNDAVFIAPKTYGLKYNDSTVVKIKGAPQNSLNFESFKNDFYQNLPIKTINNYHQIRRVDFSLKDTIDQKTFLINSYDKRFFINNKKETKPLFFNDYQYH